VKFFPDQEGPYSGTDLHFFGHQPDSSHRHMVSGSHGFPVYLRAFAGTKLRCLMTEVHESLADYPGVILEYRVVKRLNP